MAKREDINKVLIIGSGPIVIGQACVLELRLSKGRKLRLLTVNRDTRLYW